MNKFWRVGALRAVSFGLLGLCAGAWGQGFNIDLDLQTGSQQTGSGVPSSSYGAAANQIGAWNSMDAVGQWQPLSLIGLDGHSTNCTVYATGGTGLGGGFNVHGDTGDFKSLIDDFEDIGGANTEVDYHFSGFRPGHYFIYTYAVDPAVTTQVQTTVTIPGAVVQDQLVTGPLTPNTFQEGVTHSIHSLYLNGSTFDVDVHGIWRPGADVVCNGFQIVETPEPLSFVPLGIGALCLFSLRRRAV